MLFTSRRAGFPRPNFSRPVFAWVLALCAFAALLLSGCGGGGNSQSTVATGFPADQQPHTLTIAGNAANDSLALATPSTGVTTPIFFSAPTPSADTDKKFTAPPVTGGTSLAQYIKGTEYQFSTPLTFPSPITLTFKYASAALTSATRTIDPATLNVYYYDGTNWQPVTPSAGQFSNLPSGQVITTITAVQGTGLYAILSSQPPSHPAPPPAF